MTQQLLAKLDEIRALMETQMRVRGRDLPAQVRKAGRRLPRRVRHDLGYLLDSAKLAENPKLARMINTAKVARAHAAVVTHLQSLNPRAAMWTKILNITASVALALIVIFVVLIYVLVQRGFI